MAKTKELRKLITKQLKNISGGVYHRLAPKNAAYPYMTFRLNNVSFTDARDDYELEVDIWDRSQDLKTAEDIADQTERLFACVNLPTPPIYPTIFREGRNTLDDPDKTLQHIQLRFLVQLYEEE